MNSATAERLLELNRKFYAERGRDFSETRLRVQPGVRRILETLRGHESILDLGCGNGAFARELARREHRGPYVGLDSSIPLLEEARRSRYTFPVAFIQADLIRLAGIRTVMRGPPGGTTSGDGRSRSAAGQSTEANAWSLVSAFAVLHHVPGRDRRASLVSEVRKLLKPDGLFVHSHWQFSASSRFQAKIQPWSAVDVDTLELEVGDYLLDWQRGGSGLRYVHELGEDELSALAADTGFRIVDSFSSDGADRKSGLYQVWRPA